jgi:hypothetical protein
VKYLVVYLTLFLSIDLTKKEAIYPPELALRAFFAWCAFVVFTRLTAWATAVAFLSLLVLYLSDSMVAWNLSQDEDVTFWRQTAVWAMGLFALSGTVGFVQYLIFQLNERKDEFNLFTFLLGVRECDKLNKKSKLNHEHNQYWEYLGD